ncbi:PGF-CTERM-anchored ABC transporter substrate-binding protein [Haloarchaeobius sp. DFWS5]|uniref:PGF-CTERM-anchored ABC transporter substrate-binding protein n=1 Tax=Haloarchaeobius sp. DFWS5 TaxID=3446114 RepID=UPI003EBA8C01
MTALRELLVATLVVVAAFGVVATPAAATTPTPAPADGLAGATVAQEDCSFPFSATDATGTEVTLEQAPERVVTLGPGSAQTMWEIGAKAKVVGTTQYASYLDGASSRANVSGTGFAFASVEKIVAQEPDLVLAENVVSPETVQKLRQAGIAVYQFESATTIEDVYEKVELTGNLVGACDGAADSVDWMQTEVEVVTKAAEGQESPKALYVFGGYTPGPDTYISDLITSAGATNLAAEADLEYTATGYAQINPEVVADLEVEWLLFNSDAPEPRIPDSPAYQNTIAAQQNQTVVLDANQVSQPAPRSVLVMRQLAQTWYPEAYAEANASVRGEASAGTTDTSSTQTTMGTDAPTDTATATPEANDSAGGSPGFTVVGAVAALVSLVALTRRD